MNSSSLDQMPKQYPPPILLFTIQARLSRELSTESEDEDVQNEREAILQHPQQSLNSTVLIKELVKVMSFHSQHMAPFPKMSTKESLRAFGIYACSPRRVLMKLSEVLWSVKV